MKLLPFAFAVLLIMTQEEIPRESKRHLISPKDLTGSCGKNMNFTLISENGTLLINGTGNTNQYDIDKSNWPWRRSLIKTIIIDEGVEIISRNCFYEHSELESVSLPNTLTGIGENAFFNCEKLSSIIIPDSVTFISSYAFSYCSSLKTVRLSDNIKKLSTRVFAECTSLVSINIPNAIEDIIDPFFHCTSLPEIHIPINSKVSSIYDYCFESCQSLTSITFNDYLTNIEEGAFRNCIGLTTIKLPDSLRYIKKNAFANCNKLETVFIGMDLYEIYENAFYSCSSLRLVSVNTTNKITVDKNALNNCGNCKYVHVPYNYKGSLSDQPLLLKTKIAVGKCGDKARWSYNTTDYSLTIFGSGPMGNYEINQYHRYNIIDVFVEDGITTIGPEAFNNCLNITSIAIPNSITSIGSMAFDSCKKIEEIYLPDTITSINSSAFLYCISLKSIDLPKNVKVISKYVFGGCASLQSFYVHENVTDILEGAFSDCTNLKTINIPENVQTLHYKAFSGCQNLDFLNLSVDNPYLVYYEGLIYQKSNWCLSFVPMNKSGNWILNENLTRIENDQFEGCVNLESIVIPDNVTSIGSYSFYFCISLKNITIPESVQTIGQHSFNQCFSLEFITLPNSLKIIDSYLFSGCHSLQYINIPEFVKEIREKAFSESGLKSLTIPSWVNKVDKSIVYKCINLTTINYGVLESLDNISISYPGNIENITIGSRVRSIGSKYFQNYNKLAYVTFPNGLESINSSAFAYCPLKSIEFPKSLQKIEEAAFSYSTEIESITFNCNFLNIGEYAFWGCNGLTSLVFPDKRFDIDYGAFMECKNLTSITFGQSGEGSMYLSNYLFENCYSLKTINISSSVTRIGRYLFKGCLNIEWIYYNGTSDILHGYPVFDENLSISVIVSPEYESESFLGLPVRHINDLPIESSSFIDEISSESDNSGEDPSTKPDDIYIPPFENTNSSSETFELTNNGFNSKEDGEQNQTENEINKTSTTIKTITFSKKSITVTEKEGLTSSTPLYFVASNEGSTIKIEKDVIKSNIGVSTANSPKVSLVKSTNPISFINDIHDGGSVLIDVPEKDDSNNVIDHLVFNDVDNRNGEFSLVVPNTISYVIFGTLTMYTKSDIAISQSQLYSNRHSKSNNYVTVIVNKLIDLKPNSQSSIAKLDLNGQLSIFDDSSLTLVENVKFGEKSKINLIIQKSKKYKLGESHLIFAKNKLNSLPSEILLSSGNNNKINVSDLPLIRSVGIKKCNEMNLNISFLNGNKGIISSKCLNYNANDYFVVTAVEKIFENDKNDDNEQENENGNGNGKKLSAGAIAGIVIACIVVVAIIVGVVIYLIKRNKSSGSSSGEDEIDGSAI